MKIYWNADENQRFIALDMIKTVALFFMILAHVVLMYGTQEAIYSNFSKWLAFTAEGIGAPAFIFAMGASIALKPKKTWAKVWIRGVVLFCLGYFLNVLKFYPTIVWLHTFPNSLFLETGRSNDVEGLLSFILLADILQFAAVAYIICVCINRFVPHIIVVGVFMTLVIFLLSPFGYLESISPNSYVLKWIYGKSNMVYFPLFPWLGFALFGLAIGNGIIKNNNRFKITVCFTLFVGFVLVFIGIVLSQFNQAFYFGSDYYHRGFGGLIMYCGQILISLGSYHFLSRFLPKILIHGVVYCSKKVTKLYLVQWLLIYGGWCFIPYHSQPWSTLWIYFLVFSLLSVWFVRGSDYLLPFMRRNKR